MASTAPPPLKKRRREEPEPGLGSLALDLSGLDVEDDAPAIKKRDDEATEGDWVFKQDDVVLGPVSAAVLVQRIEQGELDGDTPVGREAGSWRPLTTVPYFKEILDKAEARKLAIKEQLARESLRRRQRVVRWSTLAGLFVLPFMLGAVAGRAVWIARPWDKGDEWLQRPPPLVDLPPKPVAPPPPPEDKQGDGDGDGDAVANAKDVDDDGDRDVSSNGKKKSGTKKAAGKKKPQKREPQKVATKSEDKQPDDNGGGKTLETLTQAQVMAPVSKNKGAIGSCLKTEVARNPDMPSRVTLMWTVTEAGRASGFKLKEREVRTGPLATCLNKVFGGMRWPKFTGERKNVELPLGVKK